MITSVARRTIEYASRLSPDIFAFNYLNAVPSFAYHHRRLPRAVWRAEAGLSDLFFWEKLAPMSSARRRLVDKEHVKTIVSTMAEDMKVPRTIDVIPVREIASAEALDRRLRRHRNRALVVKPTHLSGFDYVIFLKDDWTRDQVELLLRAAKRDHFHVARERQYIGLERKLIVEEEVADSFFGDYKFYCSFGMPLFCQVGEFDYDVYKARRGLFSVPDFHLLETCFVHPPLLKVPERPQQFNRMLTLASQLSDTFDFVRVDFYLSHGDIYFSEMTFTPEGGCKPFSNEAFSREMLNRIKVLCRQRNLPLAGYSADCLRDDGT